MGLSHVQVAWMQRYNSGDFAPEMETLPAPLARGGHWSTHYQELNNCLSAEATREPEQMSINLFAGVDGIPVEMVNHGSWVPLKSVKYNRPANVEGPEAYHHAYLANNDWATTERNKQQNASLFSYLEYYTEGHEAWEIIKHLKVAQHGKEAYALLMAHYTALQIIANHAAFQDRMARIGETEVDPAYARHCQYCQLCLESKGWGPAMYGSPSTVNVWGNPLWSPRLFHAPVNPKTCARLIRARSQYDESVRRQCWFLYEQDARVDQRAISAAKHRAGERRRAQIQEDFQVRRILQAREDSRHIIRLRELHRMKHASQ